MAAPRRWILIIIAISILLFIFNRWIVMNKFSDLARSKFLRFQFSCLIQGFLIAISLFNWVNLCHLFDHVESSVVDNKDKSPKECNEIFHIDINWRDIPNWRQYTVKAALWRGFLIAVTILSLFSYVTFTFFVSVDPYAMVMLCFLCFAFSIQLFAALITFNAVKSLWNIINRRSSTSKRTFRRAKQCIVVYAICVVTLGYRNTWQSPEIKEVNIPLKDLPPTLDGMTITFVSDIHLGPTNGRRDLEKIVHMINYLYSDLVVIGGDLVDGTVADLQEAVESLDWIKSKYGTYFVTGNHEYYTTDVLNWFKLLESLGVKILHNSNVKLPGNGHSICLAGVDDPTADNFKFMDHKMDVDGALKTCDPSYPVIFISHQPKAAKAALQSSYRIDLIISGHTHGGQMFPMTIGAYLFNPFYAGLYHYREGTYVYVSMGTRYWGFPVRFGTNMEITKITLVADG